MLGVRDSWGTPRKKKNGWGMCGPLPITPTLFMTKISDFPNPIYDLTKGSIPCLSFLLQTNVKGNVYKLSLGRITSSKKTSNSRLQGKNHTQFETKMTNIDVLFLTRTAKLKPALWVRTYLYRW